METIDEIVASIKRSADELKEQYENGVITLQQAKDKEVMVVTYLSKDFDISVEELDKLYKVLSDREGKPVRPGVDERHEAHIIDSDGGLAATIPINYTKGELEKAGIKAFLDPSGEKDKEYDSLCDITFKLEKYKNLFTDEKLYKGTYDWFMQFLPF